MPLSSHMSDYLENELMDHWLAGNSYTPPTNVYLAIGDAEANETDETSWTNEFSGTGYQRQQLSFAKAEGRLNDFVVSFIDAQVEFTAGGNWGTATHFTIWDSQSGGKLLFRGELSDPVDMTSNGNKLTIKKDELSVKFESETYSIYLRQELLDHVLRNESYTIPNKYVALTHTEPRVEQSASELDEPVGVGYSRILKNDWTVTANQGLNDTIVTFPTATDDYADFVRYAALADQATGGNLLTFSIIDLPTGGTGGKPAGHEVLDNDVPQIDSQQIEVQIN